MAGHAHHRPGAVLTQDEVGDPDRNRPTGERIHRLATRVETLLPGHPSVAILRAERLHLRTERRRGGRRRGERLDQRMLGRQHDEVRAIDRVDARGENLDRLIATDQRKPHARAFRSADPVALHHDDLVGPVGERLEPLQELVGVLRDAEEPLLEVPRRDGGPAAPARAVNHLLVGEHGIAARTPVHR